MIDNEEYLTYKEICERLKVDRASIKRKIRGGYWLAGTHYVNPPGMHIRFCWGAIKRWMSTQSSPKRSKLADPSINPETELPPHFRNNNLTKQ